MPLGLKLGDLGKRIHGTTHTLFYCDELIRIYGSEDLMLPLGRASLWRIGQLPVSGRI
jgi:hypothetical protein